MPPAETVRIAFHTLGCRLNQYDTELMKSALPDRYNLQVVGWNDEADVYVLNSCTVTLKADQKCRQMVRSVKRRHPRAKVAVTGCYAQTQPAALEAIDALDAVVGVGAAENIESWLPRLLEGETHINEVRPHEPGAEFPDLQIKTFAGRTRAYLKMQDGCDLKCAYCLIWQARGPVRSKPVAGIVDQIGILADQGFRELVLTGVHVGSYGQDLTDRPGLSDILPVILDAYPDMRFRLSSIHPNELKPDILDIFRKYSNIRPYLHISLQSGSDTVLRRMRRPYTAAMCREVVEAARQLSPDFGLGADIIAGFPGETDTEFLETHALLSDLPFAYLHVFRYSPRPGTAAADMPQVHNETISARAAKLRTLSQSKRRQFEASLVGKPREAIIETDRPRAGWLHATTDNYATVLVPDSWTPGQAVELIPSGFLDDTLVSESIRLL
jgi:threonylcarbamoyladenosine tRNA methylthiotransferase MtaB